VVTKLLGTVALGAALAMHPLHTTLTELRWSPGQRVVEIRVRAFVDDLRAAVARYVPAGPTSAGSPAEAALSAYLAATLTLMSRDGTPVTLSWCGARQTGDLLWLCLRGSAPGGLAGARVRAAQLCDLYRDQINIVQVDDDGRTLSMLFTRGDLSKPVP
jgi:hypothetical protein